MREMLTTVLQEAMQGSRKVLITFKRESIGDISYFLGMVQGGIVEAVHAMDFIILMAVNQSGSWEKDSNRTLEIRLTDRFDEDWFVGRMSRALESIKLIEDVQAAHAPKTNVVVCQTCGGQLRPEIEEGGCCCDLDQFMADLEDFGYTPIKTQKPGALRKMKSPDGRTIREDAFGAEIDRLLSE